MRQRHETGQPPSAAADPSRHATAQEAPEKPVLIKFPKTKRKAATASVTFYGGVEGAETIREII